MLMKIKIRLVRVKPLRLSPGCAVKSAGLEGVKQLLMEVTNRGQVQLCCINC